MFIFDRLYGKLAFPPLIGRLLDCPGLLRLREVRMANIPFFSFPSFAAVNRYEHSLGVCHLAGIFAKNLGLLEKEKIEVMLAALYHDVATPPFAHAVEEVLSSLYGFDHEKKLQQLIIGQTDDLGKHRAQLFLGHSLKLHSVCQSKEARKVGIDIIRIAKLAAGDPDDPLGDIICSKDIDLDNADNVFRAATAMGVYQCPTHINPENIAKSFMFDGSRIFLDEGEITSIKEWLRVRELLYKMIYKSLDDFAQQTMLKHAMKYLSQSTSEYRLQESDWCLTDDELIHQRLLRVPKSAEIVKKMRLGKFYSCLSLLLVQGVGCIKEIASKLDNIEQIASEIFSDYFNRKKGRSEKHVHKSDADKIPEVVANIYPDKRFRQINRPLMFMGCQRYLEKKATSDSKLFLGIFTPFHRKWDVDGTAELIFRLKQYFTNFEIRDASDGGD